MPLQSSSKLLDEQHHLSRPLANEKNTDQNIQKVIIDGLISWIQDTYGDEISIIQFPPHKQEAFQQQLNLGWFAFLAGFIPSKIAHLQQQHYSTQNRKTTGTSWASQLIQKIWHILYELWLLRNKTLHQNTINNNHGLENLDYSITVEYHIDALGLPSQFNGYFSPPLATILAKDTEQKKKWFRLIRRAREVREITIRDSFHTIVTLHNWVHLSSTT